ncbi:MAG: toll/interleukin-1 receptor domain-containing protein [Methylovirgula sp.]|nr:toll/interleukin-1 receptor domain-containing protein [Methylovirgula sp.]
MTAETADAPLANSARIFISYSRKDLAFAERLAAALVEKTFEPFIDKTDIAPGEPWQERLAGLIASGDSVVFVVSPDSAASQICGWEVAESARLGKRILPLVARATPPDAAPQELAKLNWIFATDADDFDAALDKLAAALTTDLPWVREHTRLGDLARRWDAEGRSNAAVLRGADIEAAEAWLAARPAEAAEPTELQAAFIQASRRAASTRQRRIVAGSIGAALFSLALAGWALINRQEAVTQREAANVARNEAVTQRDLAETAQKEAVKQRDAAEAARDRAEKTLAAATGTAQSLSVDLAHRFRDEQGIRNEIVQSILAKSKALLDQLEKFNPPTDAAALARIEALSQMALTLGGRGDESGLRSSVEAYDIAKALRDRSPETPAIDSAFAHAAEIRAEMLYARNDPAGPLIFAAEADKAYGACAAQDPAQAQCSFDQVNVRGWGGNILNQQKNYDAAIAAYQSATDLANRFAQRAPGHGLEIDKLVAALHMNAGNAFLGKGELDQALQQYESARAFMEKRAQQPDAATSDLTALANTYNSLAKTIDLQLRQQPDRRRAAQELLYLAGARDLIQRVATADPNNASFKNLTALLQSNFANACANFGLPQEASACLRAARAAAN